MSMLSLCLFANPQSHVASNTNVASQTIEEELIEHNKDYDELIPKNNQEIETNRHSYSVADTIDPMLYSTFLGGSRNEEVRSLVVDSQGNLYATGWTNSDNFPLANEYDDTRNGGWDVFVLKISADRSQLLYSTYIGGTNIDVGQSIAVDGDGNAYVVGHTQSPNFPMVNAYNSTFGGNWDCFVLKLNSSGGLEWSTYMGGSEYESAGTIALDDQANLYVSGGTNSTNFPREGPGVTDTYEGNGDSFVFRMNSSGNDLAWTRIIGGSEEDRVNSISCYNFGVYLTGYTSSTDFNTTAGAFNRTHGGGKDSFVFRLNKNSGLRLYSTFIGGESDDIGEEIVANQEGVFVTGHSDSSEFPTVQAYDSSPDGIDAFVFKMDHNCTALYHSTFIGGSETDYAYGLVSVGNWIYLVGGTNSSDFPMEQPYDSSLGGEFDIFLLRLYNGDVLDYTTYVGGSNSSLGLSMAIDSLGNAFVAGWTQSTSGFPSTNNALNSTHGGLKDGVLFHINTDTKYPTISDIQASRITPEYYENVTISASVTDDNSGIDYVHLNYRFQPFNGTWSSWIPLDMVNTAGDTYEAEIPSMDFKTGVEYYVTASDRMQNSDDSTVRGYETEDHVEPEIMDVTQTPEDPEYNDTVTVVATVVDYGSGVKFVKIAGRYRLAGGDFSNWIHQNMTYQGSNQYNFSLPTNPYNTEVEYYIWCRDYANQNATSAVNYTYTTDDSYSPEFVDFRREPNQPNRNESVIIGCTVNDPSGIHEVILTYSIDNGSTWIDFDMTRSGLHWVGEIPGQEGSANVSYRIRAQDNAGNWGVSQILAYSVPPVPNTTQPILIGLASLVVIIILIRVMKVRSVELSG
jgi:hypothetical protein